MRERERERERESYKYEKTEMLSSKISEAGTKISLNWDILPTGDNPLPTLLCVEDSHLSRLTQLRL